MKSILVIGGTGVQGRAVITQLSRDGHHITVLTRSKESAPAKEAAAIPNVTLVEAGPTWQDEGPFLEAARKADVVYVNTDGSAGGPIIETYWGIRLYELARHAGVKHFVYSSLDYGAPTDEYDPKFNCGHYAGKGRVVEFLKSQPTQPMAWTATISGPYIEMLWDLLRPRVSTVDSETYEFQLPLRDGQLPFVHLADFARYVSWIVAHPEETAGRMLDFASVHAGGEDIASAFTATTGKPARYVDLPIDAWNEAAWGARPAGHRTKFGAGSGIPDLALPQSYGEDFAAWWQLYRRNKGDDRTCPRDFDFIDGVLPDRVRSVEQWMSKVAYTGTLKPQLNSIRAAVAGKA